MGCGTSTAKDDNDNEGSKFDFSRRNTIVEKPNVVVEIGKGVKKIDPQRRIVFIFGGPGSAKGCIVNDLKAMFGFAFISAEDLILQKLPTKAAEYGAEPVSGTHGLAELLKDNPEYLTLDWVMEILLEEIEKYPNQPILVDLIPNLKFMMRVDGFIKKCDKEMEEFERKCPCAFALNLTLSKETLLKNIKNSHSPACAKPPSKDPKDASSDQGDEMDTSRTKRRFALYEKSVSDFLHYFGVEDRIVRVDTSAAQVQHIWEAMMDFFAAEMDFSANKVINTVVLFSFDQKTFESIDTNRYPMKEVLLHELIQQPQAPAEDVLSVLAKHLDESALQTRAFLVDVSGTSIDEEHISEQFTKPQILFVDVDIGQLDYFMHGLKRKTGRKKSIFRKKAQIYKAVSSTENETLLFPEHIDTEICRRIAICLAEQRTN
ncbi:hypothetical protein ACROYT_G017188 [Oculina patagonica]